MSETGSTAENVVTTDDWRSPVLLLMLMAAAMQLAFASWSSLMNNFAHDALGFTGREIGIQQSIREIPGFLAFAAVFLLLYWREQTVAMVSLLMLGGGVAATGYFPTATGFYLTTFIGSVGFHYYETMNQSLTLQWLPKNQAPAIMGKILRVSALAQLLGYLLVFIAWKQFNLPFTMVFMLTGGLTVILVFGIWLIFPVFPEKVVQHKKLILRRRYWLYYALTFMGGARRQIFLVFASFMMVEKFGYPVHEIAMLFFINGAVIMILAPTIGAWIGRVGERRALTLEYIGLVLVFTAYAFVTSPWMAAGLYIIDHAFFAMAIAMKTYFQKIADPADMAPTAGVAFTINHIAAVVIPVVFGTLWLVSPAAVFLSGTVMALISLVLARLIPHVPEPGRELIWMKP